MEKYTLKKNLPFKTIENLDFPLEVQIQTITMCNSHCLMCPYTRVYKKISHGKINVNLYKKTIDECSHFNVRELKPFLMNEPLLDHRLPTLILYARRSLPKTTIGFSTNGQLLEGKMAKELPHSGVNEIWINFNGGKKETYEKIMKGLSFEKAIKNILAFKERVVKGGFDIKIFISTVETSLVINEIQESISFWEKYDIPVVTTPLNNRGGNLKDNHLKALRKIKGHRVCDRPFYKIYILYNGDVILCSSDWMREIIIGNVAKSSIYEVWNGEKQKQVREAFLNKDLKKLPLCQECDYIHLYQ